MLILKVQHRQIQDRTCRINSNRTVAQPTNALNKPTTIIIKIQARLLEIISSRTGSIRGIKERRYKVRGCHQDKQTLE